MGRFRALGGLCLLLIVVMSAASGGTKLSVGATGQGEMILSVDPAFHQKYGLAYPVTYKIGIPVGSTGLRAYYKFAEVDSWSLLTTKTSADQFSGEQVVRFEPGAGIAYVSVAFSASTHDIFLKITADDEHTLPITFQGISRYYDDRKAVVTINVDDWKDYWDEAFLTTISILRTYSLPLTAAIITGDCGATTWQHIQTELDRGNVEAASHTRTHSHPPYADPTGEVTGSRDDILDNLTLPQGYRKGSKQYVYTFVSPYGETNSTIGDVVTESGYLLERLVDHYTGSFSAWDASTNRYGYDGVAREMGPVWGSTDINHLNSGFDLAYTSGGLYHLLLHPAYLSPTNEWVQPYFTDHLDHISNRTDVWYVTLGHLYVYHLLQDEATGDIEEVSSPLVQTEPSDVFVQAGQPATFSVTTTGTAPLSHQWQKNGVNIPGATAISYTLSAALTSDSGATFRCIVSNPLGSDTSRSALLAVGTPPPPVITTDPVAATVTAGSTASFSVVATGTAPLTYQWQKNSANISGATAASYTTAATVKADSGSLFRCIVSNAGGKDTSAAAILRVTSVPPNILVNNGFESGATDWDFYSDAGGSFSISSNASQGTSGALITIEADGTNVQLNQTGLTLLPNTSYTISFDAYCSSGNDLALTVCQNGPPYTSYGLVGRSVDLTSSWKSFTVQFTTTGFSSTVNDGRLLFWLAPYDQPGDQYHIDNVVLATTAAIAPTPPAITTQPVAQTVALGSTATFSVVATGSAPLTYQWQKNSANISGATAASYTTAATVRADSGSLFRCIVSNTAGKDTSATARLIVIPPTPPAITTEPVAATVTVGSTATFTVVATGTAPLTYQWQKNSANISGATAASYTTAATVKADSGALFRCIVSNTAGIDTSVNALLRVTPPPPPVITTDPVAATVTAGSTASFSVVATGTAPLTYQWQKNSANISGATAASYTTAATVKADSGALFRCIVSNAGGKDTSAAAILRVTSVPPNILANNGFESGTTGWVFYSDAGGSFSISSNASQGTKGALITIEADGTNVQLHQTGLTLLPNTSYTISFDAYCSSGNDLALTVCQNGPPYADYGLVGHSVDLTSSWKSFSFQFITSGFSSTVNDGRLLFWLAPYDQPGDQYHIDNVVLATTASIAPTPPAITTQPVAQTVALGSSATFTVVATGTAPLTYQWQKNSANISGATAASYTTAATVRADSGSLFRCIVSNDGGSATSSAVMLSVLSPTPPVITTEPVAQTVALGSTATFSVVATGTAPLTYQWQKNSANISGATAASYTTAATVRADSGALFRCIVSNSAGKDTSINALLSVQSPTPPVVTADPRDTTVQIGQTAKFTVAATGSAPLTYQWQKNSANISGATAASYTTAATVMADSGALFRCIVSNTAGKDTSASALLTVQSPTPPVVTADPRDTTVQRGQTARFSISATGSATLTYQWQRNGTNVSGATSASYTTAATVAADSGVRFRCIVSNTAGKDTSTAALLRVMPIPPVVTADPRDTTVQLGQTARFTVTATGTATLTYQWQKNSVNISGATAASYTTAATVKADSGALFRCIVSNAAGKDTSALARLLVISPTPAVITTDPVAATVTVGSTATFGVVATGTAPLTYQWQKNSANISGATAASYTTAATVKADSGSRFRCIVSNAGGKDTSASALLRVTPVPPNILANSGFESGTTGWVFYSDAGGSFSTSSTATQGTKGALVTIYADGSNVQLHQIGLTLLPNTNYTVSFDAYCSSGSDVAVTVCQNGPPYADYGLVGHSVDLTSSWKSFSFQFITSGFSSTVSDGRFLFWFAPFDQPGDQYHIDNVVFATTASLNPAAMALRGEAVVPEEELAAPTTFMLYNNYPNPFNPSTSVRFDIPEPSEVSLVVYSLLGEEVARISEGYREAGRYTVRWEGTSEGRGRAASGVYLLRMQARRLNGEVFTETRRMLLVK